MLIYIRHSKEENGGDATHRQDPKLTRDGKHLAKRQGYKLVEKYGIPTVIYCSPLRRTQQTLEYMLKSIPESERRNINIIYENGVSRYFSTKQKNIDIATSTKRANIPVHESQSSFKRRVTEITVKLDDFISASNSNFNSSNSNSSNFKHVVWCITHTTVYKLLAEIYNVDIPRHIPFMYHFIIDQPKCTTCQKYHTH
jgi:broad specificity phosphatase PhoE